ncbi:MAG: extracellular solute-binding protein [Parvibaculaceae bacterium]
MRGFKAAVAAVLFSLGSFGPAGADPSHGLSIFGDLKYAPGFAHFSYVNPEAPKGGTFSQIGPNWIFNQSPLTFDSLNSYILKGNGAMGAELTFDTLMSRSGDEPDAVYGLVARTADLAADGNSVVFDLRPEAHFHDGTPLTAEDAAFSFMLLKEKGHPLIALSLREMETAEALGPQTLKVTFTGDQTRDLPLLVAQLPIFSKAYYSSHAFDETTLEPPLGSGPYKVGAFEQGRFITYERVDDYWARDLNVNVGRWNFDEIRYEFYRDRTAQFEAFKAGEYLLREEFTSKVWATEYNFPAVEDGRVVLLTTRDDTPSGAQGWFLNTRRPQFADVRVREALGLAFDFEWTNRNHFFDLYTRTGSYFENSTMRAEGEPSPEELALLEPYRDQLPERVFGPAIEPPVSNGSGKDRRLLLRAGRLLDDAGWTIVDGKRRNADGEVLTVEFLNDAPTFERVISGFQANLQQLGIDARIKPVNSAEFQERVKTFDFDIVTRRFSVAATPGVEVRSYWSSESAEMPGSSNLSGIADPVVDALAEKVISAATREDQVIAARALDRVLRAGFYWVPHWYKAAHNLAFWDVFARPEKAPRYSRGSAMPDSRGVIDTWWIDPAKAENAPKAE